MTTLPALSLSLPKPLQEGLAATLDELQQKDAVRRLWARDPSLWTGADEDRWLGWLGVAEIEAAHRERYQALAEEVKSEGFADVVLLGMGGSSLAPDVLRATFGPVAGFPRLQVLDSTSPQQVRNLESRLDLGRTLFVVASKSGSTLEPSIFYQYFFERARQAVGDRAAPRRFIAITDPGSKLENEARGRGFRHIFAGIPSIGGRYSALSAFGLVPAALLGLDLGRLLERAQEMSRACGPEVRAADNPGFVLGALLGAAARAGRDKLTILGAPPVTTLGAWLEQLVAESTGKQGRGIIPVDGEPEGRGESYGQDRLFVRIGAGAPVDRLVAAGHPVAHIGLSDPHDLFAEMLRWEIATAVAGSLLSINPFDQPDVEASKVETRRLTEAFERSGKLPVVAGVDIAHQEAAPALLKLLGRLGPGDYFALLAYLEMCPAHEAPLQEIRIGVRDARRVATCLGFGPRFLHSTGQAYKGGPASGVFLQLTCDPLAELPIPGSGYGFGLVQAAQAAGDLAVLEQRGRRSLRVHLGSDVVAGLYRLRDLITTALGSGATSA